MSLNQDIIGVPQKTFLTLAKVDMYIFKILFWNYNHKNDIWNILRNI